MSNDLVQALVTAHEADEDAHNWIAIDAEIRIQVVETEEDLRLARRNQKAAFVKESRSLFVWSDKADTLLSDAEDLLNRMMDTIWTKRNEKKKKIPSNRSLVSSSTMSSSKSLAGLTTSSTPPGSPQASEQSSDVVTDDQTDRFEKSEDFEAQGVTRRPIMLFAPMTTGLAIILAFAIVGASTGEIIRWSRHTRSYDRSTANFHLGKLLKSYLLDGNATRFALLAALPFTLCVSTCKSRFSPIISIRLFPLTLNRLRTSLPPLYHLSALADDWTGLQSHYQQPILLGETARTASEHYSSRVYGCDAGLQGISRSGHHAYRGQLEPGHLVV